MRRGGERVAEATLQRCPVVDGGAPGEVLPGGVPADGTYHFTSSGLNAADVADYAVGCNTSAGWAPDPDGAVRVAHTHFLPAAEVERVRGALSLEVDQPQLGR